MPFVPDPSPSDNIGVAPEPVPVGKKNTGVLAALANSPADDAVDARLEAANGRSEYDYEIGRLKPPRTAAEAQAQSDLRAFTPASTPTGGGGHFVPDDEAASAAPSAAPPAAPRHGAAAIPSAAEEAGQPYVAPPPPPPAPPEPSIGQKVQGGIEAGLNIITSLTTPTHIYQPTSQTGKQYADVATGALKTVAAMPGQILGTVGGTAGGIAGALATGSGLGDQGIEQAATEGAQQLTPAALAPSNPNQEAGAEAVGTAMNEAAPLMGHAPELASLHAGAAPVTRMVGDTTRAGAIKAGTAAAQGLGKVVGVDPELAKVAQTASDLPYPIDVAPDQVVANAKFTKLAGQAARDVPLSGSKTVPNQVAFTRNLIDLINPDETAERLTPQVFADAMNRSGQGIGDIAAKTPVPVEDLNAGLEKIRDFVNEKDPTNRDVINAYINELQGEAGEDGMVDGTALRKMNSEIGERARNNAGNDLGASLNDLQGVIQGAVEKNIADPADAQAFRDYKRQYAYGKILEPAVAKTIDGLASPSALMNQVASTKLGKHLMAMGKGGPIGDLAKVGQIIKEPGSSLTAERGLIYGAAGLAGHYTGVLEPHTAAGIWGGANLYNRLGPKVTRAMISKGEIPAEMPPGPPPEPTTSPGAGGGGGGAPPAGPGPLGDLTPDWSTTPGAGGGPPRGGNEPGLVPSIDETPPTTGNRKAPLEVPPVPGRPDLPDTMVSGGPAETAATEPSNAAMQEPGAVEARRQQEGAAARANPAPGPSIAEAQRLLAENPSPETRAVLEQHIEAAKQAARDRAAQEAKDAQAAQLERTARTTTDPVIQKKLLDQADKLRGAEKIPVGQTAEGQPEIPSGAPTKPLPVGKAIEGEPAAPKVPTPKATERPMTEDEWKTQFKLGDQDAERAKAVAQALQHDPEAVEKAATQHENSPRAFDRVIQEINDAHETQPAAGGGEGNAEAAGAAAGTGAPVRAASTEGTAPLPDQPAAGTVSAAERGAEGNAEPQPAAAVPATDQHAGANGVPEAGRGGDQAAGGGRQDTGQQQGAGTAGVDRLQVMRDPAKAETKDLQETAAHLSGSLAEVQAWAASGEPGAKNMVGIVQEQLGLLQDELKKRGIDDTATTGTSDADSLRRRAEEAGPEGPSLKVAGKEETPVANFKSPEEAEAHLRSELGNKLIDGLQAQGLLKYENSVVEGRRARGMMAQPNADLTDMSNTHATLYWDRLSPDTAAGTLMHELGEHFGMIRMLGSERYKLLLNEVKQFGKSTDPEIKAAWDHVKDLYVLKDTDTGNDQFMGGNRANPPKYADTNDLKFLREVAAHLVETKPDLPFVRRLINDVRVFFYTHFKTTLGTSVDANLLRGLAASALRKASEGKFEGQTATAKIAAPAKSYTPMVAKRNDGFPPLYQ